MVVLYKVVFHSFGHTAEHTKDELASFLLLGMQCIESSVYLVFGNFAEQASIKKDGR